MAAQYRWAGRRDNHMRLLRLIASRMRQRGVVIEHRAKVAHVKLAAADFTFPKMLGFAQWRDLFSDDRASRNRRHSICIRCRLV